MKNNIWRIAAAIATSIFIFFIINQIVLYQNQLKWNENFSQKYKNEIFPNGNESINEILKKLIQ
jgi:hypothetical protein